MASQSHRLVPPVGVFEKPRPQLTSTAHELITGVRYNPDLVRIILCSVHNDAQGNTTFIIPTNEMEWTDMVIPRRGHSATPSDVDDADGAWVMSTEQSVARHDTETLQS